MPAREEASVSLGGLMPGELVLRGGFLKEPALLTTLIPAGTKQYLPCWKTDPVLNTFLTPVSSCKRPLADCGTLERLLKLRNDLIEKNIQAQKEQEAADAAKAALDDDDPIAALGLDAPAAKPARRPRARGGGAAAVASGELEVALPGGAIWKPRVLLGDQKKALALEATGENLESLLELVRHDCGVDPRRERAPCDPANVRDGPPNCREYRRAVNKWERRERTAEPLPRPYSRRYRSRMVTDGGAPCPRKRAPAQPRKKRARKTAGGAAEEQADADTGDALG